MKEQYVRDICRFIGYNLLKNPETALLESTLLIESGIIDSFGIVEIVVFIEEKYDINLTSEDLVVENFSSIGSVAELVKKKKRS